MLLTVIETRRATDKTLTETRRATDLTHMRELYTAAVGLLGSDKPDVRIGGIYALASVAEDSEADRRMVTEVLSAFVREQTTPGLPGYTRRLQDRLPALADREADSRSQLDTDIQAALTILGRFPPLHPVPDSQVPPVNLVRVQICKAFLPNADFTDAWLGAADLTGAILQGADLTRANLHGTDLTGVNLSKTVLVGARLNNANLKDAQELTQEQSDSTAAGNAETVLPQGVRPPTKWSA